MQRGLADGIRHGGLGSWVLGRVDVMRGFWVVVEGLRNERLRNSELEDLRLSLQLNFIMIIQFKF